MTLAQYRPRGVTAISLLSAVQSLLRLVFFYLSVTGEELLEVEIASSARQMIDAMFLLIGVVGLVTAYGLYKMRGWGYWGTILLSLLTIVFDAWGLTMQYTAAMGLVLPIFFVVYLLGRRSKLQEVMR